MKAHLKAAFIVSILLFISAGIFYYFLNKEVELSPHVQAVRVMEKNGPPAFEAETIDGVKVGVANNPGKLVVINFWASWCAPCIEEIPSLVKLAEHFKDRIEILAISGDEKIEDIHIFLKSFPVLKTPNIKIIWDKDRRLNQLYGVQRLPESFVVRPSGKLEKKVIGSISWYSPDSVHYVESLLKRQD